MLVQLLVKALGVNWGGTVEHGGGVHVARLCVHSVRPGMEQKRVSPAPPLSYTCCWDLCQMQCPSSPDLAEHIQERHVDAQAGGVSADKPPQTAPQTVK